MPIEINWQLLMPELVITLTLLIVLVFDLFDSISKTVLGWMTIVGAGIALWVSIQMHQAGMVGTQFSEMFKVDNFSLFFNIIFLVSTILVALISISYLGSGDRKQGPYYILILLATLGMMLMAAGNELIIVFLGLELMSLSLYILAGYFRESPASSEAGMKYLLLGAFASAFFLYGIALIYGGAGTTSIPAIAEAIASPNKSPLLLAGMFLLIVGFGFKVAIVPFHQWAPDVYEGAPTTIAAFISAGPKAAGFAGVPQNFHGSVTKPASRMERRYHTAGDADNDGRKRHCDCANQHQTDAGVFEYRARWLYPDRFSSRKQRRYLQRDALSFDLLRDEHRSVWRGYLGKNG